MWGIDFGHGALALTIVIYVSGFYLVSSNCFSHLANFTLMSFICLMYSCDALVDVHHWNFLLISSCLWFSFDLPNFPPFVFSSDHPFRSGLRNYVFGFPLFLCSISHIPYGWSYIHFSIFSFSWVLVHSSLAKDTLFLFAVHYPQRSETFQCHNFLLWDWNKLMNCLVVSQPVKNFSSLPFILSDTFVNLVNNFNWY